jgi:hypothetical protein
MQAVPVSLPSASASRLRCEIWRLRLASSHVGITIKLAEFPAGVLARGTWTLKCNCCFTRSKSNGPPRHGCESFASARYVSCLNSTYSKNGPKELEARPNPFVRATLGGLHRAVKMRQAVTISLAIRCLAIKTCTAS